MDDAALVRGLEGLGDLSSDQADVFGCERAAGNAIGSG
jgi:hypothetical protein